MGEEGRGRGDGDGEEGDDGFGDLKNEATMRTSVDERRWKG